MFLKKKVFYFPILKKFVIKTRSKLVKELKKQVRGKEQEKIHRIKTKIGK